jgi:hypothetical protein
MGAQGLRANAMGLCPVGGSASIRLKVLILASFSIIAFLAVLALAIDWENAQGRSAEDLFATEEGYEALNSIMSGMGASPQLQREMLKNTSENPEIFEPIPGTLAGVTTSAKESRNLAEGASQIQEQPETSKATEGPAAENVPTVRGTWTLQLPGESPRNVSITLFQSGNAIFGTGTVSQGKTLLEAAASGSVNGDQMNLDITTLKGITLYRTKLTLAGNSAAGSYEAFSAAGDAWTGDVREGKRTMLDS